MALPDFRGDVSARSLHFFAQPDMRHDLLLDPPYQRGAVWGSARKRNLIRSLLCGVPIPAVVLNNRLAAGFADPGFDPAFDPVFAVVDGKQRVTALREFVDGVFAVPGDWFDLDTTEVRFGELDLATRRHLMLRPLAVVEGRIPTVEGERELFDLLNFGGLAQGEVDADA